MKPTELEKRIERDNRMESMWRHVDVDPAALKAQTAYTTIDRLVRDRLPEPDRWLMDELDEAYGASLAAVAEAVAAWAPASR